MRVYYDLHIHSALSPCGDEDMTPNNIVNMACLKGLDVIAVTDHNSCGNVRSVMEVAGDNLLVIPGMEIETAEEIHILAYFPTIEQAEAMASLLKPAFPIKNRPEIFGRQLYMDPDDNIIGEEPDLLVTASSLSVNEVFENVRKLGGVPVPAHIDRTSYSIISNLGFIPPELNVKSVEITEKNLESFSKDYDTMKIFTSSDAHYLGNISEPIHFVDISSKSMVEFLCKLSGQI